MSYRPILSILLASTVASAAGAADQQSAKDGFDGHWSISMDRSSVSRPFGEKLVIGHSGGREQYEAIVVTGGKRWGVRYDAPTDGTVTPTYDPLSGKKTGSVKVVRDSRFMTAVTIMPDDSKGSPTRIQRWLSNDGRTITSLLLDGSNNVTAVLAFNRE